MTDVRAGAETWEGLGAATNRVLDTINCDELRKYALLGT
jgi:hypothetical protein